MIIKSNAKQDDRFATGAVGLVVASRLDLVERNLCRAHLEFNDVNLVGQFEYGINASLAGNLFWIHREAKQAQDKIDQRVIVGFVGQMDGVWNVGKNSIEDENKLFNITFAQYLLQAIGQR